MLKSYLINLVNCFSLIQIKMKFSIESREIIEKLDAPKPLDLNLLRISP